MRLDWTILFHTVSLGHSKRDSIELGPSSILADRYQGRFSQGITSQIYLLNGGGFFDLKVLSLAKILLIGGGI